MVLPGVKNEEELAAALQVLEASDEETDYGGLLAGFGRYVEGECTYCNHCLPCPEVIDIGRVICLLDMAASGLTDTLLADYESLEVKASACTGCGACSARCPFGVDVLATLGRAVQVFERRAA
jgi:predicted aldo/keto reductase-like oxidoreductase